MGMRRIFFAKYENLMNMARMLLEGSIIILMNEIKI